MKLAYALLAAVMVVACSSSEKESDPLDWPHVYEEDGHEVVVFQPQIDSWTAFERIEARAALAVTVDGTDDPIYGSMTFAAKTEADFETRAVLFDKRVLREIRFPNAPASLANTLRKAVEDAVPTEKPVQVPLDFVLANVERSKESTREIEVNMAPPPIFHSERAAVLVMYMDEPRLEAVDGTDLLYVTNTNWDVFLHTKSSTYYLRHGAGWLQAPDPVQGPWVAAGELPADFSRLPKTDNWADVRKNVPGVPLPALPRVFTATQPSELILTDGKPSYEKIEGTQILFVTNTTSDLFMLSGNGDHYFLTAGRWFRASSLNGPWISATRDLPTDFKRIPDNHAKASVLASVPGTPEAEEALLQASIPRKATVDRSNTTVQVAYEGEPEFVLVDEGSTVAYAVNSPNDVFYVEGAYYCCYQGVWFIASSATGPWAVAVKVPKAIYGIPSTHPKHNVTYVYVYDTTPDAVVVGYTAGYVGVYACYGVAVFGLGYWWGYSHYHHHHHHHYHSHPHFYSYGCHAHYDHYSGTYSRGAYAYGPYGGAGRGATYNPRTGVYSRGAYAYGPQGSRFAQQAYNPRTGTYAARSGGSSPYGAWSRGSVSNGNRWAQGGRATDGRTTVGGFETSRGARGVGASGPDGRGGAVQTRNGDVYVGRDGNVYKKQNGQWQSRQNGQWSNSSGPNGAARTTRSGTGRSGTGTAAGRAGRQGRLESDSRARSRGTRNSERFRSSRSTGSSSRARSSSSRSSSRSRSGRSMGGRSRRGGGGRRR